MSRKCKGIYALYKGDRFICMGTVEEIAEKMGVSIRTIRFYASPVYQRRGRGERGNCRRVLVKILDEEECE